MNLINRAMRVISLPSTWCAAQNVVQTAIYCGLCCALATVAAALLLRVSAHAPFKADSRSTNKRRRRLFSLMCLMFFLECRLLLRVLKDGTYDVARFCRSFCLSAVREFRHPQFPRHQRMIWNNLPFHTTRLALNAPHHVGGMRQVLTT